MNPQMYDGLPEELKSCGVSDAYAALKQALEQFWPESMASSTSFAKSLCSYYEKHSKLSTSQRNWAVVLAYRAISGKDPIAKDSMLAIGIDVAPMFAMFTKANEHLKFPKIRFDNVLPGGGNLTISLMGSGSKMPGTLGVTNSSSFHDRIWYGRILQDGVFLRGKNVSMDTASMVLEFLKKFAADPVKVAAEYGIQSGSCCFCHLPLTTDESLAVGYGPVCAKHYGLPWGA